MDNGNIKSKANKGAIAELIACSWLLNNGYEVFRNVSSVGRIDIIAKKNEEILLIDVTKACYRQNLDGSLVLQRNNQKEMNAHQYGIKVLYANNNGCVFHEYSKKPKNSCKICNKEFDVFGNRTKFCSTKCRSGYYSYKNKKIRKVT